MKKVILAAMCLVATAVCQAGVPAKVTMTKEVLRDKMMGAWAGQVIGCTYGGPTEFRHPTTINKCVDIPWHEHICKQWYDNAPFLYDDVYMDLTFMEVYQKEGLDAPVEKFAHAFADADYSLWHANMQARYNIKNGIMPPLSGYWENNPHADDIDFQIEADYAGIMCPGMVNTSVKLCDDIGHIMNYGDGWYGGVYVAALYTYAFVSDDIEFIASEALKTIPEQSRFHKAMADVMRWHKQYPEDWNLCWALTHKEYGYDVGCPEGVFSPYDIDAVLNSAYVLIGLLYGEKNYYRTIDIACRCGADSDCNPATAGGILGTIMGFENIPGYWRTPIYEVADRDFPYTSLSLNKATDLSLDFALQLIERGGGKVNGNKVTIVTQRPETVRLEQCFPNHWPSRNIVFKNKSISKVETIDFKGNGIVVRYNFVKSKNYSAKDYTAEVAITLDGKPVEVHKLPNFGRTKALELFYKYNIPMGDHVLGLKWLNPVEGLDIVLTNTIVYSDTLQLTTHVDE